MCKSKPKKVKSATLKSLLAAMVMLVALSGCAVKFVYNQLDWAIPWYLSDYLSLNGSQEAFFEKRLDQYLTWHRKTQLPKYGAFLEQVAGKVETGITEESIRWIQTRTRELGEILIVRLAPDMIELFQQTSDKQIAALYEKFAEDNEEYREEYVTAPEKKQRERRAEEIADYIERWTGSLTDEQLQLIREGTENYALMGEEFLQARIAWQDEFRRILAIRQNKQGFSEEMTALLMSDEYGQTPSFQEKLAHNQALLESLYFRLDKTLSKRQRQKAVNKLRSYAEDFHELAAED